MVCGDTSGENGWMSETKRAHRWAGATRLYEQLGFHVDRTFALYSRPGTREGSDE